jgi:hypothetical protein
MARAIRCCGSACRAAVLALALAAAGCAGDAPGLRAEADGIRFVFRPMREAASVVLVLLPAGRGAIELPLRPAAGRPGEWEAHHKDLFDADYRYFYRVDGRIMEDPFCLRSAADDFGGVNGIFSIRRVPDRGISLY